MSLMSLFRLLFRAPREAAPEPRSCDGCDRLERNLMACLKMSSRSKMLARAIEIRFRKLEQTCELQHAELLLLRVAVRRALAAEILIDSAATYAPVKAATVLLRDALDPVRALVADEKPEAS